MCQRFEYDLKDLLRVQILNVTQDGKLFASFFFSEGLIILFE